MARSAFPQHLDGDGRHAAGVEGQARRDEPGPSNERSGAHRDRRRPDRRYSAKPLTTSTSYDGSTISDPPHPTLQPCPTSLPGCSPPL